MKGSAMTIHPQQCNTPAHVQMYAWRADDFGGRFLCQQTVNDIYVHIAIASKHDITSRHYRDLRQHFDRGYAVYQFTCRQEARVQGCSVLIAGQERYHIVSDIMADPAVGIVQFYGIKEKHDVAS